MKTTITAHAALLDPGFVLHIKVVLAGLTQPISAAQRADIVNHEAMHWCIARGGEAQVTG